MKASIVKISRVILTLVVLSVCTTISAQIKYDSNGKLTIGDTTPYEFYGQTIYGSGMYFKCRASNFFQIDVSPAATRLASHYDQVIFYNTKTNTFNSIQVKNVYNYSDARAKTDIQSLDNSLDRILKLRPVSYTFSDNSVQNKFKTGGNGKEIGLLAQEVEKILPNIVLTDPDGNKLINYTAIIPVMIDAIKTLQAEIEELKNNK